MVFIALLPIGLHTSHRICKPQPQLRRVSEALTHSFLQSVPMKRLKLIKPRLCKLQMTLTLPLVLWTSLALFLSTRPLNSGLEASVLGIGLVILLIAAFFTCIPVVLGEMVYSFVGDATGVQRIFFVTSAGARLGCMAGRYFGYLVRSAHIKPVTRPTKGKGGS